jgi:hypothetical protein
MDIAAPALEKLAHADAVLRAIASARTRRSAAPAGTGNRCIMLKRGYLECLAPTGDTPVANQLRTAIQRYVGVHSIIFGTGAADADHARLAREGFSPLEPIALQRQLMTQDGEHTARSPWCASPRAPCRKVESSIASTIRRNSSGSRNGAARQPRHRVDRRHTLHG